MHVSSRVEVDAGISYESGSSTKALPSSLAHRRKPELHGAAATQIQRPWTPEETDRSDSSWEEMCSDSPDAVTSLMYIWKCSADAKCGVTLESRTTPELQGAQGQIGKVFVKTVMPGGLASEAGLQVGDCIASINGVIAQKASRCAQIIKEASGTIELAVRRPRAGPTDPARCGSRASAKVVPLEILTRPLM